MFDGRILPRRSMGLILHLLLVLSLCPTASARAQAVAPPAATPSAILSGQLLDPSGAPLPSATVSLTPANSQPLTTQTDPSGLYTFATAPSGPATLSIQVPGFMPLYKNVILKRGHPLKERPIRLTGPDLAGAVASPESDPQPEIVQAVAPGPPLQAVAPLDPGGIYGNPATNFVTVSSNAVAGPMGYVASPSLTSATQSQPAQEQAFEASQRFNYPSIIFYISAVPLVNPSAASNPNLIQYAQETEQNPLWLDASFTLTFLDTAGNPLPYACTDGSVQVLGLLPQPTVSALKNRTAANVATSITDTAGAIASFFPTAATPSAAATSALNVVFQNIFPPQPVAFEYSNMNGNCNFGWYFRPNTSSAAGASGPASILGIQTGIVLLKTSDNIAAIRVNGRSLSAWSKPPTTTSKKLFAVADQTIGTIHLPDLTNINYDNLTAPLSMFPSLISKPVAMKILHISTDADFLTFAKANKLTGTNPAFDYITNASLSNFLTSGATPPPPTPPPAPPPAGTPVPTPKPSPKPTPPRPTKAKLHPTA